MKKFNLLLIFSVWIMISYATTFYVRNNPQQGEYGSIKEALEQVTNTTILSERDVIDVLGVFTDTIRINKSVVIEGHGWSNSILQSFETQQNPEDHQITASVIIISGGSNVDIKNLTVRYGIDNKDKVSIGGGGIAISKNIGGKVYLEAIEVAYNYAAKHSGGIASVGANLEMKNCFVHNNKSIGQGGGMNILSSNAGEDSDVLINGCTFAYNSTTFNTGGGIAVDGNGIYGDKNKLNVSIENTTIVYNESAAFGGGVFAKGITYKGVTPNEDTNVTLTLNHCTVARNKVTTLDDKTRGVGLAFGNVNIGNPYFSILNSIVTLNEISDGFTTKYDANFEKCIFQNAINTITGFTFGLNDASFVHNSVESKIEDVKLDTEIKYINNSIVPVLPLLEESFAIDFCTENINNIPISIDQSGLSRIGNADAGASEFAIQSSISQLFFETPVRLLTNPVQDKLLFESANYVIHRVSLYTITGVSLLNESYDQAGVDISTLSKGIYLANIKLSNGNKHVIRFMKN